MGFFGKIFSGKQIEDSKNDFWKVIRSYEDLELAQKESFERKILIFKHSTRCFISKTVLSSFEKQVKDSQYDYTYYFLDLIAHRSISNEIETRFGVVHQSPQLIVLEKGRSIFNASHHHINLEKVN